MSTYGLNEIFGDVERCRTFRVDVIVIVYVLYIKKQNRHY